MLFDSESRHLLGLDVCFQGRPRISCRGHEPERLFLYVLRLSVFNHTYPVPRDLKCFSALGPESKVISKFSFRLSGCLIMVFQGSGPGHVKTYWDGPILLPIKCKIRLVCLYVHTSYWAIWFWLAYSSRLFFFPFGVLPFPLYGSNFWPVNLLMLGELGVSIRLEVRS